MGNYLKKKTGDGKKPSSSTVSKGSRKGKGIARNDLLSYSIAILGESNKDKLSFLKRYTSSLESLGPAEETKHFCRGVRCTRVSRRGCKHRQIFLAFPDSGKQQDSKTDTARMCSESSAIILLYSIYFRTSFAKVISQWELLHTQALEQSKRGFCVLLVGLSDNDDETNLRQVRQVTMEEAADLSKSKSWDFFELRLRSKASVNRVLGRLAKRIEFVDEIRRRLECALQTK